MKNDDIKNGIFNVLMKMMLNSKNYFADSSTVSMLFDHKIDHEQIMSAFASWREKHENTAGALLIFDHVSQKVYGFSGSHMRGFPLGEKRWKELKDARKDLAADNLSEYLKKERTNTLTFFEGLGKENGVC